MRRAPLLLLPMLLILILGGCARPSTPANPFERSSVALDPAVESNWPSNWETSSEANAVFAAFVHHAESDKNWLLLGHKGEAVYVRAKDPDQISVTWQGRSNKVETLKISGECEVLSLRQYWRGRNLQFTAKEPKLALEHSVLRKNIRFQ